MSAHTLKTRIAWLDRFRTPTPDELLSPYESQIRTVIEHVRERLRATDGVKESLSWQGVWNWTLVYRIPGEGEAAWAYLIPDPMKPRLAVPMLDEMIPELPIRRLSKAIRDGLIHAPIVDGVRWAHWEVQHKTQADDIVSLATLKLKLAKVER